MSQSTLVLLKLTLSTPTLIAVARQEAKFKIVFMSTVRIKVAIDTEEFPWVLSMTTTLQA